MAWTWTSSSWKKASELGKSIRSSEFTKIGAAVGKYNSSESDPKVKLQRLKEILDAIAEWRIWKQKDKFKDVDQRDGSNPRKYASADASLRERGKLGNNATFSVRDHAVDRLIRDVVAEIDDVLATDRAAWGRKTFSDPSDHKDDNFMYLVSSQTETPLSGESEWRTKTIQNPDLIKNAVISASAIRNDNIHLWGPAGFVLSVPKRCLGAAYTEDITTDNIVATKHDVEKYREMLRLYLGTKGSGTQNIGLASPAAVLPHSFNHHSEVAVLGRTYDKETEVTGIYLLVDQHSEDVAGITPASCYRSLSQFMSKNPPKVTYVVETLPSVTDERMAMYRALNRDRGLPFVQVVVTNNTRVNGKYVDAVYKGTIRFPFDATNMVLHGSEQHRKLEQKAKARQLERSSLFDEHHDCSTCGSQ